MNVKFNIPLYEGLDRFQFIAFLQVFSLKALCGLDKMKRARQTILVCLALNFFMMGSSSGMLFINNGTLCAG